MTQPAKPTTRLEVLFTQALRLLGVRSPGSRFLTAPLDIQNVQVLADVSDVTIPHSNPVFGFGRTAGPIAAEFSIVEIRPTNRTVRVRQILVSGATTPRFFFSASSTATLITNILATELGITLGPLVNTATALVTRGTTTLVPIIGSFLPDPADIHDFRPPLLIAPGVALVIGDSTANTTISVSVIYEEIPSQGETVDLGFPEAGDP